MENNDILKIEDVMKLLDIGKNTLYRLLKSGDINAFKIGKVWKIPKSSIDDFVNRQLKRNTVR